MHPATGLPPTLVPSMLPRSPSRAALVTGVSLLVVGTWTELRLATIYEHSFWRDRDFLQILVLAGVVLAGLGLVIVAASAPLRRYAVDPVSIVIGSAFGVGTCAVIGADVIARSPGEIDTCLIAGMMTLAAALAAGLIRGTRQLRAG